MNGPTGKPGAAAPALTEALSSARSDAAQKSYASAAHAQLARILGRLGEGDEALGILRDALQLGGGRPEDWEAIAFAAFTLNDHLLARQCYRQVVALAPADALARYNLASAERNLGALDAAEVAANDALERDPTLFQAALLRSQLRTQQDGRNNIAELRAGLQRHGAILQAQIFLNYALGKELEDLGRFDEAFPHFAAGAHARRGSINYDVGHDLAILQRIEQTYPESLLKGAPKTGRRGTHAFIVGMPRSGTTLIERVLTGHAHVRSNGETDNFTSALLPLVPGGPGDIFQRAAAADHGQVGAAYRRFAGAPSAPDGLVLEKLPLNYLYVGAIALALPDAPIVLLRRNPLDNILAMFTTLFGAAYPFSYDLGELARYYAAQSRLMAHWTAALPGNLLQVDYEAFVERPDDIGPRIAAHCGIGWEADSLHIERNENASTTASAVQIRKPIYKDAAGRWRNYERHLTDLRQALQGLPISVT